LKLVAVPAPVPVPEPAAQAVFTLVVVLPVLMVLPVGELQMEFCTVVPTV
jgi:hypothetical protein